MISLLQWIHNQFLYWHEYIAALESQNFLIRNFEFWTFGFL